MVGRCSRLYTRLVRIVRRVGQQPSSARPGAGETPANGLLWPGECTGNTAGLPSGSDFRPPTPGWPSRRWAATTWTRCDGPRIDLGGRIDHQDPHTTSPWQAAVIPMATGLSRALARLRATSTHARGRCGIRAIPVRRAPACRVLSIAIYNHRQRPLGIAPTDRPHCIAELPYPASSWIPAKPNTFPVKVILPITRGPDSMADPYDVL